jgi:hypothetical protein
MNGSRQLKGSVVNKNVFGGLAISGGAAVLILDLILNDLLWGAPGTAAYSRYELLNRMMALALLLIAAGLTGLFRLLPSKYGRWAVTLPLIGLLGMAAGTAAEFWLFTNLSYEGSNLRHMAFNLFSMSSLVLDIGATWLGIILWSKYIGPHIIAFIFVLALPIDFAAFFLLDSIFLGAGLLALNAGCLYLRIANHLQVNLP